MLRNKLFLIIVSVLSITLFISGTIYFNNINDIFNKQIQKDIAKDKQQLKKYIENLKDDLVTLSDEISKNDDLKSSLNLISLYEDPNDYVKETFDFEKNNLIELSKKWIKDSAHYSFTLFNKDLEPIMINRNLDQFDYLGYVTYNENGKKQFFDYNLKKTVKTPFISKTFKNTLNKFQLDFHIERFLISYLQAVYLDNNLIGYVNLTKCIDAQRLKSINQQQNLSIIMFDENNNYLFPSNEVKNKYKQLQSSNDLETIKLSLLQANTTLYAQALVDKRVLKDRLKSVIYNIIEIWIVLLVVAFLISIYFINRSILKPMDSLKDTINKIKKGDFNAIKHVKADDEISQIVNDFNDLSSDLSKNIAFLQSYEIAMDESSIVTKADLSGNITYANENFYKITGFSEKETIGSPHSIVRSSETSKEVFKDLWHTIKSKNVWKGVLKNKGNLEDYWVDITILPILNENREIIEYIAIRHDITKMVKQQEKLDSLANTDTLTGLGNRYKLNTDIKKSISPALSIINLDGFSQINDFYGHEVGDHIIVKFGEELLKTKTGKGCEVYHLQGDEYVLFHKNTNKEEFIENIKLTLEKLKNIVITINGESISFNFSTSISFEKKETILTTGDMALKIAKKENKDMVIYDESLSLNDEYENNIKWAKKVKEAISNGNIVPVFQPIVNNTNGIWEKYECLVRLQDEDKLVSPFFFLEIAKKTKHYTDITKIMLTKSFEMFQDKEFEFSVNLTIDDILNDVIKSHIFAMLKQYNIGDKVVFEIVESESIENFDAVFEFIQEVKSYGCKVAIDDFGTGYSNFEYLVKLKVDYLKIDGSLIKGIDQNKTSEIVVKNLVNFAKDLGMKTIAEFVEDEPILQKVKALGIDYSQGYHFSAPKKELQGV